MTHYYQIWAKRIVSAKDWDGVYSKNTSYCFLRKEGVGAYTKVWMGFLTGDPNPSYMPEGCYKPTDMELIQIDQQRRSHGVFPTPLKDIKVDKRKATPETLSFLDRMKVKLIKGISVELPKEELKDNLLPEPKK